MPAYAGIISGGGYYLKMSIESLIILAAVIFVLVLLNGFFSISEMAIISARRSIIDKLAKEGNESARIVSRMKDAPERFLATVQVGLTVVSTLASVMGGVAAIEFLKPSTWTLLP